ncbi:MAG: BON domain-containing protein [Syntrophomonadaceae bacterium]
MSSTRSERTAFAEAIDELAEHGEAPERIDRGSREAPAPQYRLPSGSYGELAWEWEGVQRGPFSGRGPKGYRRSDDRIREDVCEALTRDGELDASDITVSVSDGEVTLEGTVTDRRSKRLAEDLAEGRGVRGVRDVHNRLRIQAA